jgi:calmodulin
MMTGRTRAPPEPVTVVCEKEPIPVTVIEGDNEEDLKKAWGEYDHSLKSSISASQFRQLMAGLGENVTDTEVENILNSVDGEGKISCKSISISSSSSSEFGGTVSCGKR